MLSDKVKKPGWFLTKGGLKANITIVDKTLRRLYGIVRYSDHKFVTTNWEMDGCWLNPKNPHEYDLVASTEGPNV